MVVRLLVSALVGLYAVPALAWNALGHKVVAEIAWRELDPSTRQEIVDVLRRHPRFDADFASKMTDDVLAGDKATQDRWIFQHAAYWPDIARGLPKGERGKYDRPVWHYINFPLFLDSTDRGALGKLTVNLSIDYTLNEDPKQFNVLQAIQYSRVTIGSKAGAETKALAYCWLFHLVGDIHQPLHSTALFSADQFPKGDRGGNSIPLVRGSNLHSLWDNLLGRQHYLRHVDKEVAELGRDPRFREMWNSAERESDAPKRNASRGSSATAWAQESHELAKSFAYHENILQAVRANPPGQELAKIELPEDYYKIAGEHARRRIIAAGLRLAAVLKEFGPN